MPSLELGLEVEGPVSWIIKRSHLCFSAEAITLVEISVEEFEIPSKNSFL